MTTTAVSTYHALTEAEAIALAAAHFPAGTDLECREIGDGNLNYVYRVSDRASGKGVIIKQALPYAKVVGESWPLTLKRAAIEAAALRKHGEYATGLVPEVYSTDEELAYTIMENLSHLTIAREGLIQGKSYPKLSAHIGEYLAQTLFHTSDFALHPFEKKRLAAEFSNPELCKITEDLIFTDPFFDYETNDFEPELQETVEAIWHNDRLKLEAAKLKRSFLTEAEALLHGDLHTGSIFADDNETKVIDPEFAFYGPIGFDVGLFIANLIVQGITRNGEGRGTIIGHIENTWEVFETRFTELWKNEGIEDFKGVPGYRESVLDKIFKDTLGFAGCELIRRTIGLAHVKDLDGIEDAEVRIESKKQALRIGETLILKRSELTSIQDVTALLKEL
ncbi:S-methyl-5-thioribose kinase [Planococcus halotolerans]|uniref:S-methyl-5-thioribose kinase n=1 Tax=Planococcus halotolerans TaxID=2233542 RepID=UPI001091D5E8|nr:S-methyl-5-thioribose kinase [Planococcus halotolerans]QHJ69830.1 S-methyl-5-thioribose kinase [Planococcus halotolerans]